MKAVKINETGGPKVLKIQEITLGKPGNDEVLIEHIAMGLNYIDTYHRSGLYPLKLPSGIGMEASGIIKEVGPNVKNFSVGDKIAYAGQPIGAYSTHRIYPTKNLVKVPESIDLNIVATLMTKGLTAFYLLYKTFFISLILVTIIIYLFLGNIRALIVPLIALPVSLISTFLSIL